MAKEAKTKAQRSQRGKYADDATAQADAPRQWNDYTVRFEFPEPTELPPPLLQLIDADFKYPGREDFGMRDLNVGIDMGSRVAIVGPNGAGKTTLMNLVAGDLQPTQGDQRRNFKLRVGRYAQHFVDALSFDETPVDYLMNRFPEAGAPRACCRWAGVWWWRRAFPVGRGELASPGGLRTGWGGGNRSHVRAMQTWPTSIRSRGIPSTSPLRRYILPGLKREDMRARLGRFGLSGHHHLQPICKLSGGQKARVVFAAIALSNAHILLLDEPTNHLDMQVGVGWRARVPQGGGERGVGPRHLSRGGLGSQSLPGRVPWGERFLSSTRRPCCTRATVESTTPHKRTAGPLTLENPHSPSTHWRMRWRSLRGAW